MDADHHVAAADQETTLSVGSILRQRRESGALSLKDAEEATRISRNYLIALEEDRPEDLPSPIYLKGFIKTYATWLGLQGEELARLAVLSEVAAPAHSISSQRGFSGLGSYNWQRMVLPGVLLGALIVSSFFLPSEPHQRTGQLPQQAAVPVTVPVTPVAALQPVVSSTVKAVDPVPADTAPSPAPADVAAPSPKQQSGVLVSMKVIRNSTLSVVIDDGVSQGYELASGDQIEWKAARTIAMDISDPGSVEIELNGAPLKLKVPPGKQTYVVMDANGVRY